MIQVCVRVRRNPRKVKRPVIKRWCYTPSEESGSDADDSDNDSESGTGFFGSDGDDIKDEAVPARRGKIVTETESE